MSAHDDNLGHTVTRCGPQQKKLCGKEWEESALKLLFAVNMVLIYANIIFSYFYVRSSERNTERENPEQFRRLYEWVTAFIVAAYSLIALLISFRWQSIALSTALQAFLLLDGVHTACHFAEKRRTDPAKKDDYHKE